MVQLIISSRAGTRWKSARVISYEGILGYTMALALAGCAANGLAPGDRSTMLAQTSGAVRAGSGWIRTGKLVYHVPHYLPNRWAPRKVLRAGLFLTYMNGPVLTNPKSYLILWGYKTYGDRSKVGKLLKEYLKVEGGSGHNNIYTQYYDIVGSQTTYIANPLHQNGGTWDDEEDPVPAQPTDAQVAQEALNGVAHFGYDPNGSYIVATPHGHGTKGFGSWCAYHSSVYYGNNAVSYTNLPYMPDAGPACGAYDIQPPKDESGIDEGVTIIEGHEYGESVTDPIVGRGWYNFSYGEIGDLCLWVDVANVAFGKKSYTMQPMFSNATQSCVQSY